MSEAQGILLHNVGAVSGHVDQITTGAVGELDRVNITSGSDNVSDMGHGSTRGRAQVENLSTGLDVDIVETTQDTSSKLRRR